MSQTARYDAAAALTIHSCASLSSLSWCQDALAGLARSSRSGLLVSISATPLWQELYACKTNENVFKLVQHFLSKLYVFLTVQLQEGVRIDIVFQVLRGSDGLPQSTSLSIAEIGDNGTLERDLGYQPGPSLGTIASGGTFDHLHAGHKILLTMACWLADKRVITAISDEVLLTNKSNRDLLESLSERTQAVRGFLSMICPGLQYETPALQDVYGPTAFDPDVQGVLVSYETLSGAEAISKKRVEQGLSTLTRYVIDVISADEVLQSANMSKTDLVASKISSTAIRERIRERIDQR